MTTKLVNKNNQREISFFETWIGHPQKPKWKNQSRTRLGSGIASTQVLNKTTERQTSLASQFWVESTDEDQAAALNSAFTKVDKLRDYPSMGRFTWTGHNGEVVDNIIIQDISYNWRKGRYSFEGICYIYRFDFTITYIVDEEVLLDVQV